MTWLNDHKDHPLDLNLQSRISDDDFVLRSNSNGRDQIKLPGTPAALAQGHQPFTLDNKYQEFSELAFLKRVFSYIAKKIVAS